MSENAVETDSKWLSVAQAATVLCVSDRTVKRRIEAGEIESKLENLPRGGVRRMVLLDEREGHERDKTARDVRDTNGTIARDTSERKNGIERDVRANRAGRERQTARDTNGTQNEVELLRDALAHEREQNAFFRATIEQHQRSEAELRASLREALKAMPKQLTSGTPETVPAREISAPVAASEPTRAARSNGSENAQESGEAVSYGDIADWLEGLE